MTRAYEWQSLDPEEAFASLGDRDPREFPVGMLSQDDLSGEVIFSYLWFESIDEMLRIAAEVFPYVEANDEDEAADKKRRLAEMIEGEDGPLSDDLMERMNEVLTGNQVILWWGKFSDLVGGDSEHAQDLRREFRVNETGDDEEDVSDDPLDAEEIEGFVDFLAAYGC